MPCQVTQEFQMQLLVIQFIIKMFNILIINLNYNTPVPVAARSKALVCGRLHAEIVGSQPTGCMSVCCKCRVLSGGGLCVGLFTRPEEFY
jgi:hypothetical protein